MLPSDAHPSGVMPAKLTASLRLPGFNAGTALLPARTAVSATLLTGGMA
jgi:hypothetical protein